MVSISPYSLKAMSALETVPSVVMVIKAYLPRRGVGVDPLIAQVQLKPQPVVMSSQLPLFL